MGDTRQRSAVEVECPHCRKRFEAEPLRGGAARYRGFKCPHCRLFAPLDRVAVRGRAVRPGGTPPEGRR